MSKTNFCHHCGKPVQHDWKACPYCETSLSSLANTPPVRTPPPRPQVATVAAVGGDDREDDSYIDTMTHYDVKIDKLDIDFTRPQATASEKLQSLISNPISPSELPDARPRPPAMSREEFLAQFQREAGTTKKTNE